jgi:transposase
MNILTELLPLKGLRVYNFYKNNNIFYLRVASTKKKIPCTSCGAFFLKYGHKYDSSRIQEFQHSLIDLKVVMLCAKRSRFKCPYCKNIFLEPLGDVRLSNGDARTGNFDNLVLERLSKTSTLSSIAKEFDITIDKVKTILEKNTNSGPWISGNLSKVSNEFVLGIDEKHWLKKQYHLVLTSITDKLLLALGKGRKKKTLLELLYTLAKFTKPKAVCIDMWVSYKYAAKEVFGKDIPVIVDKFHVFSFVNRMILASKDILEYKRQRQGVENYTLPSFRPLLFSKKNFLRSLKAKQSYLNLLALEPSIKYYRDIRNMVEEMYESTTRSEAEKKLSLLIQLAWESPCSHGIDIAKTFNRWFKEITNYFDYKYTNAYTEGINNKLENINRSGYGFRNKESYLRRASLLVR